MFFNFKIPLEWETVNVQDLTVIKKNENVWLPIEGSPLLPENPAPPRRIKTRRHYLVKRLHETKNDDTKLGLRIDTIKNKGRGIKATKPFRKYVINCEDLHTVTPLFKLFPFKY